MQRDSFLCRAGSAVLSLFPHLLMTYSWMLLTFFVINLFNTAMFFLTSATSQHFEVVYAATALVCAVTALFRKSLYMQHPAVGSAWYSGKAVPFIQKILKIAAVITVLVTAAFAVPVIRALASDNRDPIETVYFRTMCLISGIVTLIFSVLMIALQHYQAKAAYAAEQNT